MQLLPSNGHCGCVVVYLIAHTKIFLRRQTKQPIKGTSWLLHTHTHTHTASRQKLEEQLQKLKAEKGTLVTTLRSAEDKSQAMEKELQLEKKANAELSQAKADLEVSL